MLCNGMAGLVELSPGSAGKVRQVLYRIGMAGKVCLCVVRLVKVGYGRQKLIKERR